MVVHMLFHEFCWLHWEPPDYAQAQVSKCIRQDSLMSVCKLFPSMPQTPEHTYISEQCLNGDTIPFVTPTGQVYKNAFCYLCSEVIGNYIYEMQCDGHQFGYHGNTKGGAVFEGTFKKEDTEMYFQSKVNTLKQDET